MVEGLKSLAQEQAAVEAQDVDGTVQECSIETQLDIINSAKEQYINELAQIEQIEKAQNADEAVKAQQTLIWSQLDDPTLISVSDINISNEAEVRRAAEKRTADEFNRQRAIAEAEYMAQKRFVRGEGFASEIPNEFSNNYLLVNDDLPRVSIPSTEEMNQPENRLNRLRQEELTKIGENAIQRVASYIPVIGATVDYHYDKISGYGFLGALALDSLLGAGTAKGAVKAAVKATTKTAAKQFGKNLAAKINQASYNPRAMESLLASRYSASNVTSSQCRTLEAKM